VQPQPEVSTNDNSLTQENEQLRQLLKSNQDDFKLLLAQLEQLRTDSTQKQRQIKDLTQEVDSRLPLTQTNALQVEIKHLRKQLLDT